MVKRKAAFLVPLAIAAAALPAVWMGAASAAGTSTVGVVHLYQVNDKISDNSGPVTLTGAAGDYGKDYQDLQDLTVGLTEFNLLTFPDGSFALDLSTFGTQAKMSVDPSTCSFTQVVTGSIPIIAGSKKYDTGIYSHVSGTFQVKAIFAGTVPRSNGGPCDFSQADNTPYGLDFVTGTGTISGL
jgi:hypothetical protein